MLIEELRLLDLQVLVQRDRSLTAIGTELCRYFSYILNKTLSASSIFGDAICLRAMLVPLHRLDDKVQVTIIHGLTHVAARPVLQGPIGRLPHLRNLVDLTEALALPKRALSLHHSSGVLGHLLHLNCHLLVHLLDLRIGLIVTLFNSFGRLLPQSLDLIPRWRLLRNDVLYLGLVYLGVLNSRLYIP